jgi:hypothetical protein
MMKKKTMVLALASLLGCSRGITRDVLFNDAKKSKMSAEFWKAKTAQAINKPELANSEDEELIGAHDKHMALMNDMDGENFDAPSGPEEAMASANAKIAETETALTNERARVAELQTNLARAQEQVTTALANETARANAAELALKNERTAFAADLIANAIVAGRIKPADKPTWEGEFVTDFGAARAKLANAAGTVIKTAPRTSNLGERQHELTDDAALSNDKERTERVRTLVNERKLSLLAKSPTLSNTAAYEQAHREIKRERPALFQSMTQPKGK